MFEPFILLAERNPFRDMASVVRERKEHFDPLDLLPWLIVLVALFGALAIVSRWLNRRDKRRLFNNPSALFRDLCRAHELDRTDRRLLHQLARANAIEQPAALFLEPELFAAALSSSEFRRQHRVIETLKTKLFAHEAPPPKTSAAATATPAVAAVAEPAPAPLVAASAASAAVSPATLAVAQEIQPAALVDSDSRPAQAAAAKPAGRQRRGAAHERSTEDGPSLSEQHAVRALEALMKQIHASRNAERQGEGVTR